MNKYSQFSGSKAPKAPIKASPAAPQSAANSTAGAKSDKPAAVAPPAAPP